jgi:hypothetical protein
MKKERQIGIRVGMPAFFTLELEGAYKHTQGAHRALTFPDFVGLLVGMGLEQYRKGKGLPEEDAPEETGEREPRADSGHINLFDMDLAALPDLFRDFDEAMEREPPPMEGTHLRLFRDRGSTL